MKITIAKIVAIDRNETSALRTTSVLMHLQKITQFLEAALECSVYVAPKQPGLTYQELVEIGKQAGYQDGELTDAILQVTQRCDVDAKRYQPKQDAFWNSFVQLQTPDYRNVEAFDFLQSQIDDVLKSQGQRGSLERDVLVARAVADGLSAADMEVAITISVMCDALVEKDGILSSKHGRVAGQLPSEVRKAPGTQAKPALERAFPLVKDIVGRRSDGRPRQVESLDAFADCLSTLGYPEFRIWWTQTVVELRRASAQSMPVSCLVLSAAIVEGALTFVVRHARQLGLGVFQSKDFDREPSTWKLVDLIKSAATGQDSAILDEKTRFRANELVQTRQRIHAGGMLSTFPNGVPDLKPEQARDAKATAELVVRKAIDWLAKHPPQP